MLEFDETFMEQTADGGFRSDVTGRRGPETVMIEICVTHAVDEAKWRVRESGVEGYIEKDASPEMLAQALEAVADGREYLSPAFRETLAREDAKAQGLAKILSRREQQVLAQVVAGQTSKEIAESIGVNSRTVEFHRANLMAKLDAPSLADLMTTVK